MMAGDPLMVPCRVPEGGSVQMFVFDFRFFEINEQEEKCDSKAFLVAWE